MKDVIRILHLDDDSLDAELVEMALRSSSGGMKFELCSVRDRGAFEAALADQRFDVVLSDYSLPGYDGLSALALVRERDPDVPFILVSGALGEERAVQCIRSGVTDYVLKENLAKLAPTIQRAVSEDGERRERRRMEEALREQAEMLNQAHDAIVLLNLEGRILYWNAGAERLYGWSSEEVVGRPLEDFFSAQVAELMRSIREETASNGVWKGEIDLAHKSGERLLVETHHTLIRDGAGRPKGSIAISADITEKKRLEAQLLRAQRMESIGTLAGGIAHDLNNVLGPILLSLPLLRESLSEERDRQLIDQMETTARRGAAIVRQVLVFARGADGERSPVQIRHLIGETRKILGETFPRTMQLHFDSPRDIWLVHGDPTQIQQVLMNLCVNARDAMGDDGRLTVDAENTMIDEHYASMHVDARPGPYVMLRVTDSGCGIPESIREKIFDPFFTTKEIGKGTGLGLSTVAAIVKSHGGFVNVYSEPGKGTTFRVYLPAEAVSVEQLPEAPSRQVPGGRGETILVVDDEESILRTVKRSLERHGYKVLVARDGTEALATFVQKRSQIALVLTDMMMPVLDGAATARALKSIDPNVKIIVSSGLATNGGLVKATEAGIRHFLHKPYTVEAVLKMLRQVLDEKADAPAPEWAAMT